MVDDWLFEPLFRISRNGTPQPALAHAVETLADGRLRFQLRPGATFSDGSPVTLEDAARTVLAQGLKVETGAATLTVSDSTPGIAAESLLAVANVTKTVGATRIGSGPFIIVERDAQHLLLRRRESAPRRINQVRLTSYDGPREAMARVLRGDANFLSRVQARDVEFFEGIEHLQIVRGTDPHAVALA